MGGLTPKGIITAASEYDSVLEIGCGRGHYIKRVQAERRVGMDICSKATDAARRGQSDGPQFICEDVTRLTELFISDSFECVIGMDIIEHFVQAEARRVIAMCEEVASRCVIFFIPVGKHPQTKDDRGFGNDWYQTHRSTWYPKDMEELGYEVSHWPNWHKKAPPPKERGAMCCRKLIG